MTNPVIDAILNRSSSPKLIEPGPSPEALESILACGQRAPDHARLKPWAFWLVQGDDRIALGELFAQAALSDNADSPEAKVEKCRAMPLRAPLLIVATCEPTLTPKVPNHEQQLAVGAAIQNMQIAIASLGLGSIWRTGEMAEHSMVKSAFNLSEQGSIVGFLYVGTPEKPTAPQNVDPQYRVQLWPLKN